ncbi:Protein kinase domain - like 10, partial [Theobroma cacao]
NLSISIQTIAASHCNIGGNIPGEIGNLINLINLYIPNNELIGSIPTTIGRLEKLQGLFLHGNKLEGSIPSELCHLKSLGNQLAGSIPTCLGDIISLRKLFVDSNKLIGSIPSTFTRLVDILQLDLNNFSGIIPKSLQKLLHLEFLNVSFNRLQGEIPNGGPFANYSIQSFMGNEALCGAPRLQLPPCTSNSAKHSRKAIKLIEFILLPVGSTLLILALIVVFLQSRKKHAKQKIDRENSIGLAKWRRISYQELYQATNGFCESKLLGVGSFGSVYQGTFSDGLNIAIKVFNLEFERSFKSFDVECEVLRNIRHRNLVKIISSCCNVDFKALVLEFMPNGSLEKWLYSHNYFLNILHRLNIMIDVASALEYLHHGQTSPVAHCDLKPNNVLLDEDMVAHLGDFGIAKLLSKEDSTVQTITLATI